MESEKVKAYFDEYCDKHMWVSERFARRVDQYVKAGKLQSIEQMKEAIEKHSKLFEMHKRWFLTNMGRKEVIKFYYKVNELFFPIGKECEIQISGKYNYLRLSGSYKVVVVPYFDYKLKCCEEYSPFIAGVEAEEK